MAFKKALEAIESDDWFIVTGMLDKGELSAVELNKQHDKYPGKTLLTYAVEKGQVAIVDRLLFAGANIDCEDKGGATALIHSAEKGHLEVVRLLLDRGADPNATGRFTALIVSAMKGHLDVFRLLLDRGADPNAKCKAGLSVLILSAERGRLEEIQLLLDRGADPNSIGREGYTALEDAKRYGRSEVVHLLEKWFHKEGEWRRVRNFVQFLHMSGFASQQWSIRHPDPMVAYPSSPPSMEVDSAAKRAGPVARRQQRNVLHNRDLCRIISAFIPNTPHGGNMASENAFEAMERDDWNILSEMLDKGELSIADINKKEDGDPGRTLLTYAAEKGQVAIVDRLLLAGADIELRDKYGTTALTHSAHQGHLEVAQLLLDRGADPNVRDGTSALIVSARKGHLEVVRLLLDRGADPNATGMGGTAIIASAMNGHLKVVRLLLDRGADPNATNDDGNPALIVATKFGHFEVVQLLLDKGIDPNTTNKLGYTALSFCLGWCRLELVWLLLDRGADPNATDKCYIVALRFIRRHCRSELGHRLEKFFRKKPWRRVRSFVQFLHMSGFASQQWSVRHPDPMAAYPPLSPPSIEDDSAARPGPVASRQQRNVLHNRDLCRIISAYIPNILCAEK